MTIHMFSTLMSKDPSGVLGGGGQDRQESHQVSAKGWQEIDDSSHPNGHVFTIFTYVTYTRFQWQKTTNDSCRQCMQCMMYDTRRRDYRLHCCEPFCRSLCIPFLNTSFSTFFRPSVSVLLFLLCELSPRPRMFAPLLSSSSLSKSPSLTSISSISTSPSPPSSRFRFFPDRPVPPVPPPILTLTRGGTANPKDLATLAKSRALTLNIFLSE